MEQMGKVWELQHARFGFEMLSEKYSDRWSECSPVSLKSGSKLWGSRQKMDDFLQDADILEALTAINYLEMT